MERVNPVVALNLALRFIKPLAIKGRLLNQCLCWISKMVTLWNRFYIFSGKIKLPIVEQIIRDDIEYDSYSTGEEIIKILETDFL
jgi:hypothetical protein